MLTPATLDSMRGHLAENVMHFARVLRKAGLPVGTDRVLLALQALPLAGMHSRRDFRAVLACCMVDRQAHRLLFDQAFDLFWRDPDLAGPLLAQRLPRLQTRRTPERSAPPENRRLADAMFPHAPGSTAPPPEPLQLDASMTWSDREHLRHADFDTMSAEEWHRARRLLAQMQPFFEQLRTRRMAPAAHPGRIDGRATLRAMARHGGELWDMRWRRQRRRPAPLVVLADISGSMSRYSRMLLHFVHALNRAELRISSFVFGTRLTPITRLLRERDPDLAVAQVSSTVQDWGGGTRLGACLHDFNRLWARRVLAGNGTVLLITDGLEHGDAASLAFEMERLHKSCRRLVWLNPLLRFEAFEPRAAGMRAMRQHVDLFLPAHNVDSLEQLGRVLTASRAAPTRLH
jgi:uncharacterized protein